MTLLMNFPLIFVVIPKVYCAHCKVFSSYTMVLWLLASLLLVTCLSQVPNCNGGNDRIISLPGYTPNGNTKPYFNQYSGFVQVNKTANGSIFYWFIESISKSVNKNTPILIWLNGGPGASSLSGLFAENGPYRVNSDGKTLSYNNNSWINYYHMIFVDNPIGTGFSFCKNDSYVTNEDQMGAQFVNFITGFYKCHSNLTSNPLYITGTKIVFSSSYTKI